MRLLEQVGIADQADKLPSALSGGQQQRAAIARAMANDPPVIVGDEPTGNLDTGTADAVFALFQDLVAQGKTLVIVTHDRELSGRTERVLHLLDGRINHDQNNGTGAMTNCQ
jgi:putative ABC transport system ATP-binding protein